MKKLNILVKLTQFNSALTIFVLLKNKKLYVCPNILDLRGENIEIII